MKKVFDGMTPDQVWDYIKKLPKEEREKLLLEYNDDDMKKLTKKNPQFLKGIEFNIPLFAAEKQMYLCTNVDEVSTSNEGKAYKISLSEVKQSYSVPERIIIDLFIPHTDANGETTNVNMAEVRPDNRNLSLAKARTSKQNISSLRGIKQLFHKMAKSI
jgi:hypothetical protein